MFTNLKITQRLLVLVLTIQIVVITIVYLLDRNSRKLIESTDWIVHTEKALKNIAAIEKEIVDLETGQRGYLITGKESYLEPFYSSKKVIYTDLEEFKLLTSDNPKQTKEVEELRAVLDKKIAELEQTIDLRRNKGFEEAKKVVDTDLGKNLMNEIMAHSSHMRNEELRLLKERSLVPEEARTNTSILLISVLVINVVVIVFLSIAFMNSINKPLNKLRAGIDKIGTGDIDYRIENNTKDELGQLSGAFNEMLDKLQEMTTSNERLKEEVNNRLSVEAELVDKNERIFKSNQRLRQQEQELRLSNKDLEQFAYITSHDMQEPLRTIEMFISLTEEHEIILENQNLSQYLKIISDTARGMKQKINDLLTYSKIGRDRKKEPISLNDLLQEVSTIIDYTIKESNAIITIDDLPEVYGNKTELSLLFQNLLTNAMKFHKKDQQPIVNVSAELIDDMCQFEISDNGIGIDGQYADQIFDMFKRLHLQDEFPGTGIGLAQCKKIVNLHGGTIKVQSELGKGSKFYFTIPMKS